MRVASFVITGSWLAAVAAVAAVAAGCSGDTSGCSKDLDCPGTKRCIDGTCQYPPNDPCRDVTCPEGQVCVNGDCINQNTDDDQDGFTVATDCDDHDDQIHPGASETCDGKDQDCDGATDEDANCGADCPGTDVLPSPQDPPFDCNAGTACARCVRFDGLDYYCRSVDGTSFGFVALPSGAPCDVSHQCALMVCAGEVSHCDSTRGVYVTGEVPTSDPELCDGLDNDCDGATDGVQAACPPRQNATPSCQPGGCVYTCQTGFHACADACASDASVDTCGSRCDPCPAPPNATPACTGGVCDWSCAAGYIRVGEACQACNTDAFCGPSCQPCASGTDCCGSACYNLLTDPLHCGDCNARCSSAADTCCNGEGCCPSSHPMCCTDSCCPSGAFCCPGSGCCFSPNNVCCGEGCCPDGTSCCGGQFCCSAGDACCSGGCCPASAPQCCGPYCCGSADTCCPNGCCPSSYPVCCGDGCCPPGTTCCQNETACCPT